MVQILSRRGCRGAFLCQHLPGLGQGLLCTVPRRDCRRSIPLGSVARETNLAQILSSRSCRGAFSCQHLPGLGQGLLCTVLRRSLVCSL